MHSNKWRNFAVCLSLANLMMMKVWLVLLPFKQENSFSLAHSPFNSYLGAMINTIIIATFMLLIIHFLNRYVAIYWIWASIYLFTLILSLNGIRSGHGFARARIYQIMGWGGMAALAFIVIALFVLIAFILIRKKSWFTQHYYLLPLLLFPFVGVTFVQSAMAMKALEPTSYFEPHNYTNSPVSGKNFPFPVVWVIFDELDYRMTFDKRPQELSLPEFDRFREQSLFATQAYPPAASTSISMPSLLTGISLKQIIALGAHKIILRQANNTGSESPLLYEDTIFREISKRGGSTALFGWFLPYGRMFSELTFCKDYPTHVTPVNDNLGIVITHQLRTLIESGYFSPFGRSLAMNNHIEIYKSMQEDIAKYLKEAPQGLTFLHYPIPHALNIYNRDKREIAPNRKITTGYIDNLALADRTLGDLRTVMEQSGSWDKSMVIVSADHYLRRNYFNGVVDERIPFMVKLPAQKVGKSIYARFNTVNTKQIILRVVDENIRTSEELSALIKESFLLD